MLNRCIGVDADIGILLYLNDFFPKPSKSLQASSITELIETNYIPSYLNFFVSLSPGNCRKSYMK